ncbi:MAG TPA: NAD(P)-dependent oxidoreductase [Solirubrobacterales bacterium]|nr:NAD(P)-dependent oxidoreductase [Solirubrobacterales bacterium]
MKVFVAGSTGVVGRQLVPMLVTRGHEVAGMTSRRENAERLREWGATPFVADALDAESVGTAISEFGPEAIVHQLTGLSGGVDLRHQERDMAPTNRLRTEGTDHLLSAGRAAGVRRFVAQSFLVGTYERTGDAVKSEDDPLDPNPPTPMRTTLDALRYLENAVAGAAWTDGIVLRYGAFYGPGTGFATDPAGEMTEMIRKRRLPVVGGGGGVWSFTHVDDAAGATFAALEHGRRGVYNVVDDEPAPVSEWLPQLAATLGAKPPRRVPRWVGRLLAGEGATMMMTEARGASNAKAKRGLDWQPRHPSWRRGFAAALG